MKYRIFGSISCLSIALGSIWACSSSSSSSDGGGLAGACQRVADATSAFAQRCGESLTAAGASDHDKDQIARTALLCTTKYSLPGIPDPSSQLNACTASLNSAACNTMGDLAACAISAGGTLANGTTCALKEQCAGGMCVLSQNDAGSSAPDASSISCGTCATAIAPGQPCTDPPLCASGVCQGTTATNVVCDPTPTQTATVGEPCGDNGIGCAPPGYCVLASGSSSGTCAASAKLGESCSNGSASGPLPCEPTLTCVSGTCVADAAFGEDCSAKECGVGLFCSGSQTCRAITYGPPGGSCDGFGLQCVQGTCPGSSRGGPPTAACPAIIADGKPCNPAVNIPSCDTLSTCTNGICSLVPSTSGCH
jgi:hypothetical protein